MTREPRPFRNVELVSYAPAFVELRINHWQVARIRSNGTFMRMTDIAVGSRLAVNRHDNRTVEICEPHE